MAIEYREYAPAAALTALVRCYWQISGSGDSAAQTNRVTPDGCLDVIVDLRARSGIVVGAMLEAAVFQHAGPMDLFGVRFVPGAAPIFLDLPASELTGSVVHAAQVWPDSDLLIEALSTADRTRAFDSYLLRRLNLRRRDELALRAVGAIERAHGLLTVAALHDAFNVSERTLQRAFLNAVGVTPKQLLRITRFRRAAALISGPQRISLTRAALLAGYYDQPHFTREFSELAGTTPAAFAGEQRLDGFVQDQARAAE